MYIFDYHRQIALMKEMVQLRKDNDRGEAYYHDPSTNAIWKSYFPQAHGDKRGPKLLQRTDPSPEKMEDRLEICLNSDIDDDAAGLGIELSVSPDKWGRTLDIIEQNYRKYDRKQLKIFLDYLGIFDYEGLFDELDFTAEQFGLEEKDVKKLRWKARKVLLMRYVIPW